MLDIIIIALRAVQALFAIIVLGLTGHVASYGDTPSSDSFLVFTSVWTLLILVYLALAPRFFSALAHPIAMVGLDALTMLFWFAGFIALAVFHHQAEDVYFGGIIQACSIAGGLCGEIEAAVVFGALEWALFVATTALLALEFMRGRGGRSSKTAAGPSTFGDTTQV